MKCEHGCGTEFNIGTSCTGGPVEKGPGLVVHTLERCQKATLALLDEAWIASRSPARSLGVSLAEVMRDKVDRGRAADERVVELQAEIDAADKRAEFAAENYRRRNADVHAADRRAIEAETEKVVAMKLANASLAAHVLTQSELEVATAKLAEAERERDEALCESGRLTKRIFDERDAADARAKRFLAVIESAVGWLQQIRDRNIAAEYAVALAHAVTGLRAALASDSAPESSMPDLPLVCRACGSPWTRKLGADAPSPNCNCAPEAGKTEEASVADVTPLGVGRLNLASPEIATSATLAPAEAPKSRDCRIDPLLSRVCNRGTKSCIYFHPDAAEAGSGVTCNADPPYTGMSGCIRSPDHDGDHCNHQCVWAKNAPDAGKTRHTCNITATTTDGSIPAACKACQENYTAIASADVDARSQRIATVEESKFAAWHFIGPRGLGQPNGDVHLELADTFRARDDAALERAADLFGANNTTRLLTGYQCRKMILGLRGEK